MNIKIKNDDPVIFGNLKTYDRFYVEGRALFKGALFIKLPSEMNTDDGNPGVISNACNLGTGSQYHVFEASRPIKRVTKILSAEVEIG